MDMSPESQDSVYTHTPFRGSTAPPQIQLIAAELLPAFYDELKHIAQRARSRLGGHQTLQTTA